ncbi:MAG: hypothetical protein R2710_07685 [Acidimicrobiales bacterium]
MTTTEANPTINPVEAVRAFLEEQWDPDLTVAEWWQRLGWPVGRRRRCRPTPTATVCLGPMRSPSLVPSPTSAPSAVRADWA